MEKGPQGHLASRLPYIPLGSLGPARIARASTVEPDGEGRWHADLGPVEGPVLGPFPCRSEALAAEVAWLERHWLLPAT